MRHLRLTQFGAKSLNQLVKRFGLEHAPIRGCLQRRPVHTHIPGTCTRRFRNALYFPHGLCSGLTLDDANTYTIHRVGVVQVER